FIHGVTSDWSTWEKIVPAFVTDWHCFAVDLRGHGKSGHSPGGYHRDLYATDLVTLIKNDIGEPTYVVGHSLGATTAVGIAARIPDMVRAAVYEDPPMFVHEVTRDGETTQSRFGWQVDLLDTGLDEEALAEAVFKHNGGERSAAATKAKQLLQMDIDVLRASVTGRATAGWDVVGQLKQAASSALLLTANPELGGVMTPDWTARCVALLPNCKVETWDDSGHGMHASFPDRFIKTVGDFICGVRDRQAR
uniref:alpha/beta fold hydrolase n=1 Tax=Candidatus Entotheonella palauensis TaxID=93172 RepID=UPI000B7CF44E